MKPSARKVKAPLRVIEDSRAGGTLFFLNSGIVAAARPLIEPGDKPGKKR